MCLKLPRIYFLFLNFVLIIRSSLNFTEILVVSRTKQPRKSCLKVLLMEVSTNFLIKQSAIADKAASSSQSTQSMFSCQLSFLIKTLVMTIVLTMFGIKDLGSTFKNVAQVLSSCNISFSFNKISRLVCDACQLGKSHKLPFPVSSTVYLKPLELVMSDLWGPSSSLSYKGFRYYATFVDAFTHFTWIYFLKNKSDVILRFFI